MTFSLIIASILLCIPESLGWWAPPWNVGRLRSSGRGFVASHSASSGVPSGQGLVRFVSPVTSIGQTATTLFSVSADGRSFEESVYSASSGIFDSPVNVTTLPSSLPGSIIDLAAGRFTAAQTGVPLEFLLVTTTALQPALAARYNVVLCLSVRETVYSSKFECSASSVQLSSPPALVALSDGRLGAFAERATSTAGTFEWCNLKFLRNATGSSAFTTEAACGTPHLTRRVSPSQPISYADLDGDCIPELIVPTVPATKDGATTPGAENVQTDPASHPGVLLEVFNLSHVNAEPRPDVAYPMMTIPLPQEDLLLSTYAIGDVAHSPMSGAWDGGLDIVFVASASAIVPPSTDKRFQGTVPLPPSFRGSVLVTISPNVTVTSEHGRLVKPSSVCATDNTKVLCCNRRTVKYPYSAIVPNGPSLQVGVTATALESLAESSSVYGSGPPLSAFDAKNPIYLADIDRDGALDVVFVGSAAGGSVVIAAQSVGDGTFLSFSASDSIRIAAGNDPVVAAFPIRLTDLGVTDLAVTVYAAASKSYVTVAVSNDLSVLRDHSFLQLIVSASEQYVLPGYSAQIAWHGNNVRSVTVAGSTSHRSLPYSLSGGYVGLGKAFDFIANVSIGSPVLHGRKTVTGPLPSLEMTVPSSTLRVHVRAGWDAASWSVRSYLVPGHHILEIFVSWLALLVIMGVPYVYLRYREVASDRKEARQNRYLFM